MRFFRRSKISKPLDQVGQEHFALCDSLMKPGTSMAQAEEQATDAVPIEALREADADQRKAAELLNVPDPTNLTEEELYTWHIFSYSLFLATKQAGLHRHFLRLSGKDSSLVLEMLAMQAVNDKNYALLIPTGVRLAIIGNALEDHYILVAAWAYQAFGQSKRGGLSGEFIGEAARENVERSLLFARQQRVGDQNALKMLDWYGMLCRL